jgi:hypothetical protein
MTNQAPKRLTECEKLDRDIAGLKGSIWPAPGLDDTHLS